MRDVAAPLVLPASRRKALLISLFSVGFCLAGWFLIERDPWVGWLGIAFGGLGSATSFLFLMFPRLWALELTDDGFRMRSMLGNTFIRWQDVAGFEVASVSMNTMVVFNFALAYEGKRFGRMVASDLSGWEGGIADIYGIPPAELAALLNEWKRRSASCGQPSDA